MSIVFLCFLFNFVWQFGNKKPMVGQNMSIWHMAFKLATAKWHWIFCENPTQPQSIFMKFYEYVDWNKNDEFFKQFLTNLRIVCSNFCFTHFFHVFFFKSKHLGITSISPIPFTLNLQIHKCIRFVKMVW